MLSYCEEISFYFEISLHTYVAVILGQLKFQFASCSKLMPNQDNLQTGNYKTENQHMKQ